MTCGKEDQAPTQAWADASEQRQGWPLPLVVAANPGSSVTIVPELHLLKAALLYGDKVTVLSPVTTMFLRVEGLQKFSPREQIELMRRVAPILMPSEDVQAFQDGIAGVDDFLRSTARGGSAGQQLLRAGLLQQFAPVQRMLSEAVQEIKDDAGIDQLARARARGLLQIESADPGDTMDLLVSCILSAKLAQSGEQNEDSHTDRIVETFVDKLSKHFSSGREYLIFDEPIANLTEAAIREGLFTPAKGPAGRCAQAMTASRLMGRLPTFPPATVDEVIDIRSELAPSLTQFRSAMVTISKSFSSAPWETDFEDEVRDAWVESVLPTVESIDASVKDNSSLLSLATGITGAANSAYPGLAIVGHHLAIRPSEFQIVERIFTRYGTERAGAATIANGLNDDGHRTSTGRRWSAKVVLGILRNRGYLGEVSFRDVVHQADQPLLDPVLFEKAQALLAERSN